MFSLLRPTLLSSQERQRRYLSLSPWDKATLSLVGLNHNKHTHTHTQMSVFLDFLSLCLSGPCDSLQQNGQDCCFLLHPVPALPGLLGRSPLTPKKSSWFCTLSSREKNRCQLLFAANFSYRCSTRLHGARASAETAPPSVLKSEGSAE